MPYPNIFALHQLSEDLTTVTLAGPMAGLVPNPNETARVYAVVTQVPGSDRVTPAKVTDPEPTHQARAWGNTPYDASGLIWTLPVTAVDDRTFAVGWAFVSAAAVTFSSAGQVQTYTWSRWSYLTTDDLHLERLTREELNALLDSQ